MLACHPEVDRSAASIRRARREGRTTREARSIAMDTTIPREPREPHILPDAEIERLELLALASEALIAHGEKREEAERLAAQVRRAA